MKLPVLLLAGSLIANAVLVAVAVSHSPNNAAAVKPPTPGDAIVSAGINSTTGSALDGAKGPLPSGKAWETLQSDDLHALVDRLRAAGFPPSMLRAIVGGQLNEQFAAKRRALLPPLEDAPFWKTTSSPFGDSAAMIQYSNASRALFQEQNKLMKDLLGADATPDSPEAQATRRQRYGDIPQEKIDQLQTTLASYQQLQQEITASTKGIYLPEDREKLAQIEKEKTAELARLLTPQELEDYNLRNGSTALSLRSRLTTFNPSEEEYKTIFRLQQAFDSQYGSSVYGPYIAPPTPEQMRERQMHQQEFDAQVQAALGPERAADYKQATDPASQQINRLVTRFELPPSAAIEVVAVQKDIQQRLAAVRQDRTLAPADRNAQLAALATEASTKISSTLGARAFEAYKSYGGAWMQNIQPPARPALPSGAK